METTLIDAYDTKCEPWTYARSQGNSTLQTSSRYGLNFSVAFGGIFTFPSSTECAGVSNLGDCLDCCATSYNCAAVNYNSLCQCWTGTLNGTTTTPIWNPSNGSMIAYASLDQIKSMNDSILCPAPNLSQREASNGAKFTVICGSDLQGGDFQPGYISSQPLYNTTDSIYGDFQWSWHADSYDECREMCATSHPLCRVFIYEPQQSWANCFLKNSTTLAPYGYISWQHINGGVLVDSKLPLKTGLRHVKDKRIQLQGRHGARFEFQLSHQDFRLPTNGSRGIVTQMHKESLFDCIQACALFHKDENARECIAAVFDDSLEFGWDNCYLKDEIGAGLHQRHYTLAFLTSRSSEYVPPIGKTASGLSQGEIAAVVVCSFITAATVIYLCWCWWKKKRKLKAK